MLIVGAGPAGSGTAAWAARHGLDVLLTDAATFPRDKPCGDGLTPRAIAELTHLGLGEWLEGRAVNRGLRASGFGQTLYLPWPGGSLPDHGGAAPRLELDARIRGFELAYQMQAEAPGAVDLKKETVATKKLYGMDQKETAVFGRNCLLARRLVENGVRFVQLYSGAGSKWDSHAGIEAKHSSLCHSVDQPIASLLADLKARGMLDETLVIWGGEFGRTPMSEKGDGRDHNPTGFTMWMAGGGVKGGKAYGSTDDLGLYAVEDRLHVHDIHSTILHLLGIDHTQLIYEHKRRPERIDQNEGHPYKKLLGA